MPYKYETDTIYLFGEEGSGFKRDNPQDIQKIQAECLSKKVLFEDPQFPATDSSLCYSQKPPIRVVWKRPKEITKDAKFYVEGPSRFDVKQGALGDCWLLASVASLTLNNTLFKRVVPIDQSFDKDYVGIFHFRFWQFGRWVDVVVDDRLPTHEGKLVLMYSESKNEYWSALLEKAYAKLYGSYESLSGGTNSEGLEDFTGGVSEIVNLQNSHPSLYSYMLKCYDRASLMGAAIPADPNIKEARLPNGLIQGHAYSVTWVKNVAVKSGTKSGTVQLLRIRNPWGTKDEWIGKWSDWAKDWGYVPGEEQKALQLTFDDDGEFWMSFPDFITNYYFLELCHIALEYVEQPMTMPHNRWVMKSYDGAWSRKEGTAGGCANYRRTYATNPQYFITLHQPDETNAKGKCTAVVALMQKNMRGMRAMGKDLYSIGYEVYKVPDNAKPPLDKQFLKRNNPIARSMLLNLREITMQMHLYPGTYCIIPSTFYPGEEAGFLLRVLAEKKIT